jgi:transcriptional antiterminator RfaH
MPPILPPPPLDRANRPTAERVSHAPAWYCLQTQPKHEHIAAAHLRQQLKLEVYLPRIQFKRSTHAGPMWFTEALFPGYVFARFAFAACQRSVHHARGVRRIVHFGPHWPTVPETALDELRRALGPEQLHVVPDSLEPGDAVVISGGAFDSLHAVVTRVLSSRERIAVLLDFLGRQTSVELDAGAVVKEGDARYRLCGGPIFAAGAAGL